MFYVLLAKKKEFVCFGTRHSVLQLNVQDSLELAGYELTPTDGAGILISITRVYPLLFHSLRGARAITVIGSARLAHNATSSPCLNVLCNLSDEIISAIICVRSMRGQLRLRLRLTSLVRKGSDGRISVCPLFPPRPPHSISPYSLLARPPQPTVSIP